MIESLLQVDSSSQYDDSSFYTPMKNIQFIDEVSGNGFMTYEEVRRLTGYRATVISNENTWLMFTSNRGYFYVPKKIMDGSVSWEDLNNLGLVYGKVFKYKNMSLLIRLIRGADEDPAKFSESNDPIGVRDSEWNKIFYPLISDSDSIPSSIKNPNAPYTQSQLDTEGNYETYCMESIYGNLANCVYRGFVDVTRAASRPKDRKGSWDGWRPIIEVMGEFLNIRTSLYRSYSSSLELEYDSAHLSNLRLYYSGKPFTKDSLPDTYYEIEEQTGVLSLPITVEGEILYYCIAGQGRGGKVITDVESISTAQYFQGLVSPSEFITSTDLLNRIWEDQPGTRYTGNFNWLLFNRGGKTIYVSSYNLVYNVTPQTLITLNLINGSRILNINGKDYRLRLLKGLGPNYLNYTFSGVFNNVSPATEGSEWDELMYPIHVDTAGKDGVPLSAQFTDTELNTKGGNGTISWTSDSGFKNTTTSYNHMGRGYSYGVRGVYFQARNYSTNNYGYRPVLELID